MSLTQEQFEARVMEVLRTSGLPSENPNAASLCAVYIGATEADKLQRVLVHLVQDGKLLSEYEAVFSLLGDEAQKAFMAYLTMYSFTALVRFGTFIPYEDRDTSRAVDPEMEAALVKLIERGWHNIKAATLDISATEKDG